MAVVCAIDLTIWRLLWPQIKAMRQAGYDVFGVCSNGPYVDRLRAEGLDICCVGILRYVSPLSDMKAIWQMYRLFRQRRVGIVHTHTPKAAFLGQIAAWLARVPVRFNTVHGLYFYAKPSGLARWLHKRLEVFTCRLATDVLSQSQEDVDVLVGEKLLPAEKVNWLGNGIDLERFDPKRFSPEDRLAVRRELGIGDREILIGIVARMVREKGFAELFQAFGQLRAKVPNAYLVQAGIPGMIPKARVTPELADKFGISAFCRFLGARDDVPRLMSAMDIFCLPSYREGFPRSVMEACAMELPVIVTDIRGSREAVTDGVNGLVVPPRQVQPLADAMERLATDPALRRRLGAAGRLRAEASFDETRVFGVILNGYSKALARSRGRRRE